MSALTAILLCAGALIVLVAIVVGVAWFRSRRVVPVMPPPFQCPACHSQNVEVKASGLWDGIGTGGGFRYGLCRACGSRCAQYDRWDPETNALRYDPPYVPSEDEWRQQVEPSPQLQQTMRQQSDWPSHSENAK